MLILTRKLHQKIIIDNNIAVCVTEVSGNVLIPPGFKYTLNFIAPVETFIARELELEINLFKKESTNIIVAEVEKLYVNKQIIIQIYKYGHIYRFGIDAPAHLSIWRQEIANRIKDEGIKNAK